MNPLQKIIAACQKQAFDSTLTEKRLGMKFTTDWRKALCNSMDSQKLNFDLPYTPRKLCNCTGIEKITFLGCGRIVHQKHLSALKRLNYSGDIDVYDLIAPEKRLPGNIRIINKNEINLSDIFVVATPGPTHIQALEILKPKVGKILLEKPLCYSQSELKQWQHLNNEQPSRIFVCHNYRFKQNVQDMLAHLLKYNPGRLLNVSVLFQSPPVSNDGAPWLRKERQARTLLMDYALHFLDLACMFSKGRWDVGSIKYVLNQSKQTSCIDGCVSCDKYTVNFLLRQGFLPRKANLVYSFQNYSISLRFFPDTFMPHMSNDSGWLHSQEGKQLNKGIRNKILEKLLSKDSDLSHAYVYYAVGSKENALGDAISFDGLNNFYNLLFELGQAVYE